MNFALRVSVFLAVSAAAALADGLPVPDVRLHGTVMFQGAQVLPGRNIAVEARLAGTSVLVARFDYAGIHSTDCNLNGVPDDDDLAEGGVDGNGNSVLDVCERYLLRVRMEVSLSGVDDRADAAHIGDTVNIYLADSDDRRCGGVAGATSCAVDADCSSESCLPRSHLVARMSVTDYGVVFPLDIGSCAPGVVAGSRIFVDQAASGAGNGTSWTDALTDIDGALAARSCYGSFVSEVWVASGSYIPNARTDPADPRTASFRPADGLKLYGGFASGDSSIDDRDLNTNVTTLDGDLGPDGKAYHVMVVDNAGLGTRVDGFTITGGSADTTGDNAKGGGAWIQSSRVTFANCKFSSNTAKDGGGGVYISGGAPTFQDCTFEGSQVTDGDGGAVYNTSPGLQIERCTFLSNRTPYPGTDLRGGGIFNVNFGGPACVGGENAGNSCWTDNDCVGGACQSVNISDSTFVRNTADLGGAIANDAASPIVTGCRFDGNRARNGGAMHNDNGAGPILVNSVLTGNDAISGGGAIFNQKNASPMVTNSTLAGNAASTGGAIGSFAGTDNNNTVTVTNSILWGNTATSGQTVEAEQINAAGINLVIGYSCVQGLTGILGGTGNIGVDPFFVRAPNHGGDGWGAGDNDDYGNVRLMVGSACNDAGNSDADIFFKDGAQRLPDFDITGDPRFADNLCVEDLGAGTLPYVDMGAYEFATPAPQPVMYVKHDATGVADGSDWANALPGLDLAICVAEGSAGLTDAVWVAAGTYTPTLLTQSDDPRSARFVLAAGVALYGGFSGTEDFLDERDPAAHPTILSGDMLGDDAPGLQNRSDNAYHVVVGTGADQSAVLDGFTIRGGQADAAVGTNAIGGGLWVAGGSPTIRACTFTDNVATRGAAVYASNNATPTLDRCTLRANTAIKDGGAIYNLTAAPVLLGCVIEDNRAGLTAGGMRNQDGSDPTLINCLLARNEKDAVLNRASSHPTLINCTIVASEEFGVRSLEASLPSVINAVIWSNTGGAIDGDATVSHSCVEGGFTGDANLSGDPLFVNAGMGNYRLGVGSPCVNAGDNDALLSTPVGPIVVDLDGGARIVHDRVDAGAYENRAAGLGDSNGDGRIDNLDYLDFAACLFGPGSVPSPAVTPPTLSLCLNVFDADGDGDVDLSDFDAFQQRFGTGSP